MHSLCLTVHNKGWLLPSVLNGIILNTLGAYELIVVLDGCTDNSAAVLADFEKANSKIAIKTLCTPDVFETKANNVGLRQCQGEKVIIIQDDMVIKEVGWNLRLEKPFKCFSDVFAVTARSAFNYRVNSFSQHINLPSHVDALIDDCWSDVLTFESHINRDQGLQRNQFAVRNNVNRGPLMIDHNDLKSLNYLNEDFSPQDQDDADLCYRAFKKLNKIVGAYWIDYESDLSWGGTRPDGVTPAKWLLKAHHKNTRILYNDHLDIITGENHDENRHIE